MNGYKEVEHTADIALQVWAEDFYTLLRKAAEGLYALMGLNLPQHQLYNGCSPFLRGAKKPSWLIF